MTNPRYSLYTSDKTSPRGFGWTWFFRPAQALVSLIVLGLSAVDIAALAAATGISCDIPGKMAWNLACAVLSLIVLAYLIFSSGTMRIFKLLPWGIFIQLGLDALMFIFWISAAGTSHFSCDDLVNACNACDIYFGHLTCSCSSYNSYWWVKRDSSPNPNPGLSAGLEKRRSSSRRSKSGGGTLVAREALDAIMVVLFFITLVATAWWIWQNRNPNGPAAAASASNTNAENGAAAQAAHIEEKKQDNAYSNGAPPQAVSPITGAPEQYSQQQQVYPQQPQQAYQGYPQQGQGYPQQSYPEQQQQPPPPFTGYYAAPEVQQRDVASPPPPQQQQQPQQHDIPNYPTPTPEMQAEHRHT